MKPNQLATGLCAGSLLAFCPLSALEMGPIQVHGSLSSTAAYSDEYNFYGDTADDLAMSSNELIINGTYRWDNGLRAGAQLYAYTLADTSDITLDFANLDYGFTSWFGVRAGRNKLPLGLYNDSQDLDQIRVFASLPIAFYPKTLRAITASYDGLGLYGNVGFGAAGSLDYNVFGGRMDNASGETLLVGGFEDLSRYNEWDIGEVIGTQLFWNTPLEGLKAGYSIVYYPKTDVPGAINRKEFLHGGNLALANQIDAQSGPGTWDYSGLFAGAGSNIYDLDIMVQVLSAEYTVSDFVFAAECKLTDIEGSTDVFVGNPIPGFQQLGVPVDIPWMSWYLSGTWQATERIGLGAYYCYSTKDRDGDESPTNHSNDYCLATSFAIFDWWLLKLEGHYMDGLDQIVENGLQNGGNGDISGRSEDWLYFVLKTTISF